MDTPSVSIQQNKVVLSGLDTSHEWTAVPIDSQRTLLIAKHAVAGAAKSEGFGRCPIDSFNDFMVGLNHRRWSGVVFVDTGFGQKKLFFNKGELVFASSNIMDDRLGEVIYRESMITLDQLTDSAVKVDRTTKFGQVLLQSGQFSNTALWDALKRQIKQIFLSVFQVSHVYFEITEHSKPPMEVLFDEGTIHLIEEAHSFGAQFRSFFSRILETTQVLMTEDAANSQRDPGTFLADLFDMITEHPFVTDLVQASKLNEINTIAVVHRLCCIGLLRCSGLKDQAHKFDESFGALKALVDTYSVLLALVKKHFLELSVDFPVTELRNFTMSLNPQDMIALFLEDDGTIGAGAIQNIVSQCQANEHRFAYFEIRMEALVRFLLQVAGDILPPAQNKSIRDEFAQLVSS